MNILEKRDYIHNHLYKLMDEDVDELFNKVKNAIENDELLTEAQKNELEKRVNKHKNGHSKSYTWAEIKKKIKTNS